MVVWKQSRPHFLGRNGAWFERRHPNNYTFRDVHIGLWVAQSRKTSIGTSAVCCTSLNGSRKEEKKQLTNFEQNLRWQLSAAIDWEAVFNRSVRSIGCLQDDSEHSKVQYHCDLSGIYRSELVIYHTENVLATLPNLHWCCVGTCRRVSPTCFFRKTEKSLCPRLIMS